MEELDVFEEMFLESLKEIKEEEFEMVEVFWKKKENWRKWKCYFLIGLVIVGGGIVIGVIGGFVVFFVVVGVVMIIGSVGVVVLGLVVGIVIMILLFGVVGVGLIGYKMKK